MTADVVTASGRLPGGVREFWATISAVLTKELRWRMRGRRAFVLLTVYAVLLSLLALGITMLLHDRALSEARWFGRWQLGGLDPQSEFISSVASARIGQALYAGFLGLLTLLTLLLAPALASGAVSMEREKQTLELLVTSPISTLGMLVAKLLASLAYVFLLLIASIPLMSIVFAFGGVGPEDVLRAYVSLLALAFGVGAVGMFLSALIGRTQIATVLAYVFVLVATVGTLALHSYLMATSVQDDRFGAGREIRPHAPEPLLWLNPIVADVDLVCTALPDRGRAACSYIALVMGRPEADAALLRDAFWPRSAGAFLVLGCGLTLIATQLVTPTRRLRPGRPARPPP